MSIFRDIFAIGGERFLLATGHKDRLTILSGNNANQFIEGRLDEEAVIDPSADLGNDPRMQTIFRVVSDDTSPELEWGNILTNGITKWKVIKFENNDVSPTIDYWLEQQA